MAYGSVQFYQSTSQIIPVLVLAYLFQSRYSWMTKKQRNEQRLGRINKRSWRRNGRVAYGLATLVATLWPRSWP